MTNKLESLPADLRKHANQLIAKKFPKKPQVNTWDWKFHYDSLNVNPYYQTLATQGVYGADTTTAYRAIDVTFTGVRTGRNHVVRLPVQEGCDPRREIERMRDRIEMELGEQMHWEYQIRY